VRGRVGIITNLNKVENSLRFRVPKEVAVVGVFSFHPKDSHSIIIHNIKRNCGD